MTIVYRTPDERFIGLPEFPFAPHDLAGGEGRDRAENLRLCT